MYVIYNDFNLLDYWQLFSRSFVFFELPPSLFEHRAQSGQIDKAHPLYPLVVANQDGDSLLVQL